MVPSDLLSQRIPVRDEFSVAVNDAVLPASFLHNTATMFRRLAVSYNAYQACLGSDIELEVEEETEGVTLTAENLGRNRGRVWQIYIDYDPLTNSMIFPAEVIRGKATPTEFPLTHEGMESLRRGYLGALAHFIGEDVPHLAENLERVDQRLYAGLRSLAPE